MIFQVFLTGQQPFPEGTGGAVYFSWPPTQPELGTETAWQYLGMISNQKPSAIFKISKLKTNPVNTNIGMYFSGGIGLQKTVINAQLGVSVESLSTLERLASSAAAAATETSPASRFSYINI
jgi:hypothetical protein